MDGYFALNIHKIQNSGEELVAFSSLHEAKNFLFSITEKYTLCQKVNGLYKSKTSCFQYQLNECNGACLHKEDVEIYNQRVQEFLDSINLPKKDFLFELKGRNDAEKGIVLIEKGIYRGFSFYPIHLTKKKDKKSFIEIKQDNRDVRKILFRYLKSEMSLQ